MWGVGVAGVGVPGVGVQGCVCGACTVEFPGPIPYYG